MSMLTTEYTDQHAAIDYTQAGAGVAGILNGAKLILATNAFSPGKQLPVAGLTQPTYTGYVPVVLTWAAAVRDALGDIVTLSQLVAIQMGDSLTPTTITGYGVTDGGGTHLLLSELFATPLPLVDVLTYFGLQIPFAPGNPGAKSALVTS
jgi:hypothetical protein